MTSILDFLSDHVSMIFEDIGYDKEFGKVDISSRPELSQFQCNGALAIAGKFKKNPREIAQQIADRLQKNDFLENITINGPGYINMSVTDTFLVQNVLDLDLKKDPLEKQGHAKIIIDFGGMNVAKPMHIGHLRSLIIGDSLQRLCRYRGDTVISDVHLGDWGTQMGMLITEIKRMYPDLPYFQEDYQGSYPAQSPVSIDELNVIYPRASQRCKENQDDLKEAQLSTVALQKGHPGYTALWQHFIDVSIADTKRDIDDLSIHFDLWYGESHYQSMIPDMLESLKSAGLAVMSEGALVAPIKQKNPPHETPPLLLVKSDGAYLYDTTDLATILDRVQTEQPDYILYVTDKRQSLHFEQVFEVAELSGIARGVRLEHIGFGTVNDTSGKPFKTRSGGAMRLKDLIQSAKDSVEKRMRASGLAEGRTEEEIQSISRIVGIGALKFADLKNLRTSDYIFDLDKFTTFEGKTGPYLLYAAVRIKSILRKAEERGYAPGNILPPSQDIERKLLLKLIELPDHLRKAYDKRLPHILCDYAFDLATAFSGFYSECHILREEEDAQRSSWLRLSSITLEALELVLYLLGMEIPERM